MTDTERAVIEAAEKAVEWWAATGMDKSGGHIIDGLVNTVRALRAAPKLVRCAEAAKPRYDPQGCEAAKPHQQGSLRMTYACYSPEPVEEPVVCRAVGNCADLAHLVPEREVRRREREAFERGHAYCNFSAGPFTNPRAEAAKRYPEPPDPDPQHGPVDAGPSLESRVADLERKEKAHWARLNDFDRRVTDLENDLRGLENVHITLGGIVSDEIKKWAIGLGREGRTVGGGSVTRGDRGSGPPRA